MDLEQKAEFTYWNEAGIEHREFNRWRGGISLSLSLSLSLLSGLLLFLRHSLTFYSLRF
jgi:hypothetical protein